MRPRLYIAEKFVRNRARGNGPGSAGRKMIREGRAIGDGWGFVFADGSAAILDPADIRGMIAFPRFADALAKLADSGVRLPERTP